VAGRRDFWSTVWRVTGLVLHVLNALRLLVVADALFSWVMPADKFPRSLTKPLLDPVYAPLRRVLQPHVGSVDLAPLVALVVLYLVQHAIERRPSDDTGAS
jgi:uncharacterized protein YggT (Ycf19 family)